MRPLRSLAYDLCYRAWNCIFYYCNKYCKTSFIEKKQKMMSRRVGRASNNPFLLTSYPSVLLLLLSTLTILTRPSISSRSFSFAISLASSVSESLFMHIV